LAGGMLNDFQQHGEAPYPQSLSARPPPSATARRA
jgi:hypothetical protein